MSFSIICPFHVYVCSISTGEPENIHSVTGLGERARSLQNLKSAWQIVNSCTAQNLSAFISTAACFSTDLRRIVLWCLKPGLWNNIWDVDIKGFSTLNITKLHNSFNCMLKTETHVGSRITVYSVSVHVTHLLSFVSYFSLLSWRETDLYYLKNNGHVNM